MRASVFSALGCSFWGLSWKMLQAAAGGSHLQGRMTSSEGGPLYCSLAEPSCRFPSTASPSSAATFVKGCGQNREPPCGPHTCRPKAVWFLPCEASPSPFPAERRPCTSTWSVFIQVTTHWGFGDQRDLITAIRLSEWVTVFFPLAIKQKLERGKAQMEMGCESFWLFRGGGTWVMWVSDAASCLVPGHLPLSPTAYWPHCVSSYRGTP